MHMRAGLVRVWSRPHEFIYDVPLFFNKHIHTKSPAVRMGDTALFAQPPDVSMPFNQNFILRGQTIQGECPSSIPPGTNIPYNDLTAIQNSFTCHPSTGTTSAYLSSSTPGYFCNFNRQVAPPPPHGSAVPLLLPKDSPLCLSLSSDGKTNVCVDSSGNPWTEEWGCVIVDENAPGFDCMGDTGNCVLHTGTGTATYKTSGECFSGTSTQPACVGGDPGDCSGLKPVDPNAGGCHCDGLITGTCRCQPDTEAAGWNNCKKGYSASYAANIDCGGCAMQMCNVAGGQHCPAKFPCSCVRDA